MKKLYFIFLVPLFLSAQNLEELVNLSIQNKLVDSSQKSLDSIKDEYESVKSGYMPSLDVGANHSITDKETTSVLPSMPIPPIESVTQVGSPENNSLYSGVLANFTNLNFIMK